MSTFCVEDKISIVLHDEGWVVTATPCLGIPNWVLVHAWVWWVVKNKVSVSLQYQVEVSGMANSIGGPNRVSVVINDEVAVVLENRTESAIATC